MKAIRLFTLLAACLFAMAAFAQQNPPAQPSGDDHHGGRMDMSHDMGMGHDMGDRPDRDDARDAWLTEQRLRVGTLEPRHRLDALQDAAALVELDLLLREVRSRDAVAEAHGARR